MLLSLLPGSLGLKSQQQPQNTHQPCDCPAQYAFSFAAVWGIGGNMNSSCWDKWDPFVRELFEGTANFPGGSGSVFDFYLDPKRCAMTPSPVDHV